MTIYSTVKTEDLEDLFQNVERLKEIIKIRDDEILHLKQDKADLANQSISNDRTIRCQAKIIVRKDNLIKSLQNRNTMEIGFPFVDIKQKLYA